MKDSFSAVVIRLTCLEMFDSKYSQQVQLPNTKTDSPIQKQKLASKWPSGRSWEMLSLESKWKTIGFGLNVFGMSLALWRFQWMVGRCHILLKVKQLLSYYVSYSYQVWHQNLLILFSSFDATLPVVSNTNRLHFCTRLKKEAKEASFVVLLPTCISLVLSPVRCLITPPPPPLNLANGRASTIIQLIFSIQYVFEQRFELKIIAKKWLLGAEIDPRTSRLKGQSVGVIVVLI